MKELNSQELILIDGGYADPRKVGDLLSDGTNIPEPKSLQDQIRDATVCW